MARSRNDGTIEGFVDIEAIGVGSFARVYRAADRETGQQVALKILDVQQSRAMNREVFALEARALGALSTHPHIVTLYRAFTSRHGEPVLVMELCETSLAAALAVRGAMSPPAALNVAIKLAGALATAHQAGIVHRDLKPQNVLITRYGEPALADFGVAQLRDTATAGSPASAMTLYHAAPEVVVGGGGDERSDLYSLASTLYELLAGHPPFYVTSHEDPLVVQRRVLTEAAPRIRSNELPVRLQDLILATLSKDPAQRPTSVAEFAQLLRGVEEAQGWPATDCLIEGLRDLSPLLQHPQINQPSNRAAEVTSVPALGLTASSFDHVAVPDRDLEPIKPRRPAEAPSLRPTVPITRANPPAHAASSGLPNFHDADDPAVPPQPPAAGTHPPPPSIPAPPPPTPPAPPPLPTPAVAGDEQAAVPPRQPQPDLPRLDLIRQPTGADSNDPAASGQPPATPAPPEQPTAAPTPPEQPAADHDTAGLLAGLRPHGFAAPDRATPAGPGPTAAQSPGTAPASSVPGTYQTADHRNNPPPVGSPVDPPAVSAAGSPSPQRGGLRHTQPPAATWAPPADPGPYDPAQPPSQPPPAGYDPTAALWGYGPEGGSGTVVRQDTLPPSSPTTGDGTDGKRRRFGRGKHTN